MVEITRNEVQRIAELAELQLSEAELDQYRDQLADILSHFRALEQLDTSDVPPTQHAQDVENVLRADEARPSVARDEALGNAPRQRDGFFEVPAVIERE
ncbi:MAG: Asp-tRNA(Asn)/Glu-tRNA(Gln) amidotransferase subunit GatC [Candidatus Bipolaricaulia bacterium]